MSDGDLGWAGFVSVSAWREWDWEPANDCDYMALDVVRQSANPSRQWPWSQEFHLASQIKTESYAAFGKITWDITD